MAQTFSRTSAAPLSCRLTVVVAVAVGLTWTAAARARAGHALRFWNLTANAIAELYLAPAGSGHWSANLCLSDPDKAVDPDERLSLPGVVAGIYDVRVVDSASRACVFPNVAVKAAGPYAFQVSEEQMRACR